MKRLSVNCGDPALPLLIERKKSQQMDLFRLYLRSLRIYPQNRNRIREHFLNFAAEIELLPDKDDYENINCLSERLSLLVKELGPLTV